MCIVPVIVKLMGHYLPLPFHTHPFVYLPTSITSLAGKKLGFTIDSGKFYNISLGQGQEIVAEEALKKAAKYGHWVILQVSAKCCD